MPKGIVIFPNRECPKMFLEEISFNSIVDCTFAFLYLLQDL
jgi:hypothetical protein